MNDQGRRLGLEEELTMLRQLRRNLLERLAGLEDNIATKQRLLEAIGEAEDRTAPTMASESGLRYGGVRAAILERLAVAPDGMTGLEIGRSLRHRFGSAINPKSHHAALRRLAHEGLVLRNGRQWVMTDAGEST